MTQRGKGSLRFAAALLLILAIASVLRLWGLGYGIPQTTARPDEERIVERAYHMLATGTPHPGHFAYPSLTKYLSVLALAVYYALGRLAGDYARLSDFIFDIAVLRPGLHYYICRMVSVVCGVATVGATYLLAREAHRNRAVTLVAASAMAVCYLHVRDSHFATVDVTMTLFVTLALVFAVKAAKNPVLFNFLLAGLFAGLAASSKYNGGLVLISVPVAGWVAHRGGAVERLTTASVLGRIILAGVAFVAAFAAASPYAVIEYRSVVADMEMVRGTIYRTVGDSALWTHLVMTLPAGLGWSLFLASLGGLLRAIWLRRPGDYVLLFFCVPFFAVVSTVNVVYPRYCVPLLPALIVFGAELFTSLFARAHKVLYVPAFVALIGPSFYGSILYDGLAAEEDTRVQAINWVAAHIAPQSEILICRGYGAPEVNDDRRRPPAFRPELIGCAIERIRRSTARYLIMHEHPYLTGFSRVPDDLKEWLEEVAEPLEVFDPFRDGVDGTPYFYPADAFYIPYTGLRTMARGGPIIRIWALPDR
jgi:hypothetical protein